MKEVIEQEVIPTTFVLGGKDILSKRFPVLMIFFLFSLILGLRIREGNDTSRMPTQKKVRRRLV